MYLMIFLWDAPLCLLNNVTILFIDHVLEAYRSLIL